MESLYLLIPLSVIVVFVALWIFFRAMDSGQFDDLEGPGMRILQDDDKPADSDERRDQQDRLPPPGMPSDGQHP